MHIQPVTSYDRYNDWKMKILKQFNHKDGMQKEQKQNKMKWKSFVKWNSPLECLVDMNATLWNQNLHILHKKCW